MPRFFQHLNVQDNFQQVTELDYIDNSDPSFVLYHFKDGSKCNEQFIGRLNEKDVYGRFEFVEVSSPQNAWRFHIQELLTGKDEKPQFVTNDQGTFEVPSETDFVRANGQPRQIVNVLSQPYFVTPRQEDDDTRFATSATINTPETTDITVPVTRPAVKAEEPAIQQPVNAAEEVRIVECAQETPHTIATRFLQNIQELYDEDNHYMFQFVLNGQRYQMGIKEMFDRMTRPAEPQIVEKEVIKEVIKPSQENITLNINDTQKTLVDNMIDMAAKDECSIDVTLKMKLPSITVYDVLKKNYPDELSQGFVNIIANRMKILDLKRAVAAGLLSYYNGDGEETPAQIEASIIGNTTEGAQTVKRKRGRPKKTDK